MMVFFHASVLNAEQIMNFYNVNFEVASYLEMIGPVKRTNDGCIIWEGYEDTEVRESLADLSFSPAEFERAHGCLIDRLGI